MKEGLYKVEFRTPLGNGTGVVTLVGGSITGGDSALYYVGRYTVDGQRFTAEIRTGRHTQNSAIASILGEDRVKITLEGHTGETTAKFLGKVPAVPGLRFEAVVTPLPE